MSRYAANTKVTVEASRGEISGILAKHGVIRQGWMGGPEGDQLVFELAGRSYRFDIRRPSLEDAKAAFFADGGRDWRLVDPATHVDAEWRRRWRANVLLLKAKLEFASAGDSTVERELMPYMLLRDGRTLETAIAEESLPLQLAGAR